MLLKMNTGLGGPDFNLVRGDEHDFADPFEARRLVRAGFADPANDEARAELEALPEDQPVNGDAAAAAAAAAKAKPAAKTKSKG